MAVGLLLTLF